MVSLKFSREWRDAGERGSKKDPPARRGDLEGASGTKYGPRQQGLRPMHLRGQCPNRLVGVAGFEPATPPSRTRGATRLGYTPAGRRVRYIDGLTWPRNRTLDAGRSWISNRFDGESPYASAIKAAASRRCGPKSERLWFHRRFSPKSCGSRRLAIPAFCSIEPPARQELGRGQAVRQRALVP